MTGPHRLAIVTLCQLKRPDTECWISGSGWATTTPMKGIAIFFWTIVAGIGLTFGASVYTAIQKDDGTTTFEEQEQIAVPATAPLSPAGQ